jgi:hypothetical protein
LKLQSSSKFFREAYPPNANIDNLYPSILSNNAGPHAASVGGGGLAAAHDYDTGSERMSRPALQQPKGHLLASPTLSSNTISIKENDELVISCSVNSSKPAANITMWVLKRPMNNYHQLTRRYLASGSNEVAPAAAADPNMIEHGLGIDSLGNEPPAFLNDDVRRLDLTERLNTKNRDLTMKTSVTTKFTVNRLDNHKLVACLAENNALDEKWETKRILNVLCKYSLF